MANSFSVSAAALGCALFSTVSGCRDGGTGDLDILIEAEVTIIEGVSAGEGSADMRDGWSARFDKYIVVLGDVDLDYTADSARSAEAAELFAVDLTQIPEAGLLLWSLEGLREGNWGIRYLVAAGQDDPRRDESVSRDDFQRIRRENLSYLIEGVIEKEDGQSCPPSGLSQPGSALPNGRSNRDGDPCYDNPRIQLLIPIEAETLYGPCEVDGKPGLNVPNGGSQTVSLTIHGDHLFFNGFPAGTEGGTLRLAQWWADVDLNLDGSVTRDELEAVEPADLSELDGRYQLSGAPGVEGGDELATMWDYTRAQLMTQGHFQGEGECAINGEEDTHVH